MRTRQQLPSRTRATRTAPAHDQPSVRCSPRVETEELDDLLDAIDAVLEEQDVLVNFRQRSGQ